MKIVKCKQCKAATTNSITKICDVCNVKKMVEKAINDKNNKVDREIIKRDR